MASTLQVFARGALFVAATAGASAAATHAHELEARSYAPSPVDATWFAGGDSRVDGIRNPDLQRNARVGLTFSFPIAARQSLKLTCSTGASTRRGSDFNTFTVLRQLVRL